MCIYGYIFGVKLTGTANKHKQGYVLRRIASENVLHSVQIENNLLKNALICVQMTWWA